MAVRSVSPVSNSKVGVPVLTYTASSKFTVIGMTSLFVGSLSSSV